MSLQATPFVIQAAHLPVTFKGTPDELFQAMVARMRIASPTGVNSIFTGDVEPTSNVGPWLRFGTQWWVFDSSTKRYVPLDISASEKRWYYIGASTPPNSNPPVWLNTTKDPSQADPSVGEPLGWRVFDGSTWVLFSGLQDQEVTTAKLADHSITLDKVANGPLNSLLTFDSSTNPILLPSGTGGQLLRVKPDASALEWTSPSGVSLVGLLSSQFLGPLTDGAFSAGSQSVTITLPDSREALVFAYAYSTVPAFSNLHSGSYGIKLSLDTVQKDFVEFVSTFVISQRQLFIPTLMFRQVLSAGAHVISADTYENLISGPSAQPAFTRLVSFIVILL